MPKRKDDQSTNHKKSYRSSSIENREQDLIGLAYDLAEERLRNGTATSQEVTHFLKLGSTKERLEREMLEKQKDLLEIKAEALQSQKRVEELYVEAINAFKEYRGVQ